SGTLAEFTPSSQADDEPAGITPVSDEFADEPVNESLRSLKNLTIGTSSSLPYFNEASNNDIYNSDSRQERWSLGAIASPTFYSRIGGNEDASVQQMKSSEQSQISYTGGIAFYYKLSKRFSLQTGVYYSSVGQEVNGINSFTGFQQYDMTKGSRNFEVLTTNGTVFTNNADVFLLAEGGGDRVQTSYTSDHFDPVKANLQYLNNSLQQNFSYVELPILLRYKFVDRTIDLNLIGGISYNMLVGNNVFTYIDGDKYNIGKTEGLSPISFSSSIGMGMEYSFSSSFSLNLEPTFRYYLDPFNPLEGSRMHPYSFGLFSGLRYKF
ncbi:MAG: outer membrane beta-barrel protein, partial [Bacteroidales bacterium]|nr:outer membrane beta-barrel protein [Bacteroidales bacterium]